MPFAKRKSASTVHGRDRPIQNIVEKSVELRRMDVSEP
jgi:hypothetical protein